MEATSRIQAHFVELSSRERIPILIEMMRAVSTAREPSDVQSSFGRGMRRLNGVDGYIATSARGLERGTYKITRKLLMGLDNETETPNPWRDWDTLPLTRGGLLGEIMQRGEPALLNNLRADDDTVLGDELAPFRSLIAIPLYDGGEILNWGFFLAKRLDAFEAPLVEELLVTTNLVGGTVRNVIANRKLREADESKQREINRIAAIQRHLLPTPLPSIPGAALGASFGTFDTAGGDLYAVRRVTMRDNPSAEQWLLVIADASGHGPSAAVVSAMVDAIVATVPNPIAGPGAVLDSLNNYLVEKSVEQGFVTAFAAVFDPASLALRWARAGHNPPLLRSGNGAQRVRLLDEVGDIPLGIAPGILYEETTTQLALHETLVMYTDGITEALDPSGEQFGVARIEESLRLCSGAPACAVSSITGALLAFEAGVRPGDDQTLLVLQVGEPAEADATLMTSLTSTSSILHPSADD
ncbi:MAG: SpoIIE family protein phosphatase [Phycisphaerae bacterium]|nr:SpoIIE family protein phosphatase [Phycisphaerae bacterium]